VEAGLRGGFPILEMFDGQWAGLLTSDVVGRIDAVLLDRLRELRAELVARGLPTELDDKVSVADEEAEGI